MLRLYRSLFGLALSVFSIGQFDGALAGGHQSAQAGLTLPQAVDKALAADPRLAASSLTVSASQSRARQSKAFPNPEIMMEVENFEGSGNFRGLDQAELTGTLEQRIELGGKRQYRSTAAESGTDMAVADQVAMRRNITARTTADFLNVLSAEARFRIARDSVRRVNRLLPALRRKSEAGAASDVDLSRGQVALDLAVIDRDRAETSLQAAQSQLASNWSGTASDVQKIAGRLRQPGDPSVSFAALAETLPSHPLVQRWASAKKQKQADFRYQQAQRVPDVTLGAGARQIRETDDTAFLFSVSLPIPVWDRNQGAIEEARYMLARAEAQRQAAEQDLYRQLNVAFSTMTATCGEANRLQSRIIPSASQTVTKLEDGYEQGRFSVLDLLNGITTLNDAKSRQIDSLVTCHISAAEIEYLTDINLLRPQTQELTP